MGFLPAQAQTQVEGLEQKTPEVVVDLAANMPVVEVKAESLESRVYAREEMDATPAGNRDLTSLIANHPAVRTNPAESNGNRGSLAPESFSIHGESPYQNQFLIDGISGTNVINPQESSLSQQINKVPGFSQAYNIDTDLLDQVQVHDSRIPVEFGRFQGGVVDAKIKTPTGSNTLSVKRSFNSSHLTQQQMPEALKEDWENGEAGYASHWDKHFSSMQGDLRVSDDSALLLSFSRRESQIQRQSKALDLTVPSPSAKDAVLELGEEKDRVDNLLAKLHTRWGGGTASNVLLKYANRQEDLVSNTTSNSSWSHRQQAVGLGLDVSHVFDGGQWTAALGVDQLDSRRQSDSNEFITQNFMRTGTAINGDLTYNYGGLGNASLNQRQYTAKLRLDLDVFSTGSVRHSMYAGADLQSIDVNFERDSDVQLKTYRRLLNGTQQLYTHDFYRAGQVNAGYNSLGFYVSDTMQWGNWAWTAAARMDHDNFLHNSNLSPRTRLDWDVWGNGQTQFSAGWARYFGMDVLGYALEQGKDRLHVRHIDKGGVTNTQGSVIGRDYEGLKTPHSDEWALSLTQQISPMFEAGLSYVRRASRDGITQEGSVAKGYAYTNRGAGLTETVALSLRTLKPWKALQAHWTARTDFSWQDTYKNHDSADSWETGEDAPDDVIAVNGQQMLRKDKPASGFYQPRRLSLGVTGQWKNAGVTWGNRLNWMSSRSGLAWVGKVKGVDTYKSERLPSYMTWDMSLTYQPAQIKGLSLNVDVLNLLNKQVPVSNTSSYTTQILRYQTGREIWLTAGYAF